MPEPIAANELSELEKLALVELAVCNNETTLRVWHTKYFAEKGEMSKALGAIGALPKDQRAAYGKDANRVKQSLTAAHEARKASVKEAELLKSLTAEPLDVSLPGRPLHRGRLHVATRIMREICSIFADMGFQIFRTREIEDDVNNFEYLNMPHYHPARDMVDTFYTTMPGAMLRTHTSSGQIQIMRELYPQPIRAVLPGMVYRYEAITTRSEIQFQQIEGLALGPNVTMADLKGTITAFARRLFGQERQIRIRSSYFPFTEPSIEVDIDWPKEDPNADRLTKGTGWLEILGAGMVHPVVLRNGGYDPDFVSGFAFGIGTQRITMLKYAIDDIREFWKNDLRFLQQF